MISWDFFDTLLGRSTGREPWRLFHALAGPEFAKVRCLAEAQAQKKTLDGIYARMAEISGWPAERVADLRRREWELELATAFPIHDNVRQVTRDDVIVSDTYFTEAEVRQLADKIGIPKGTRIVATCGGKHHGWIWEQLGTVTRHTGDNRQGDLASPTKHGIAAKLYRAGEWNTTEKEFVRSFPAAAGAARACRLQCPHDGPAGDAWRAQAANVAFLWLAAAAVESYRAEQGFARVLFASRDTILLQRVYAALYEAPSGVLWTSRQTYVHPTPAFVEYVRGEVTPGTVVVDLHGTGRTARQFVERTGVALPFVLVVGLGGGRRRKLMHAPSLCESLRVEDGTRIEVQNYDTGGRVLDVRGGTVIRDRVEYDVAPVEIAHAAVAAAVRCAASRAPPPSARELAKAASVSGAAVHRGLRKQHVPFHPDAHVPLPD